MVKKSNLHYGGGVEACNEWWDPSVNVTSGQHSPEEMLRWWQAIGDTLSNLRIPGIKPRPLAPVAMRVTTVLTIRC